MLDESEVQKYAKYGKEKMPKYAGQLFRVRKAIQNELGWKARRQDNNLVIYLDATALEELLEEIGE